MKKLLIVTSILLSACVSSGVLPYKDGQLTVTAEHISPTKAKSGAYKSAMSYCSKLGKTFEYVESTGEGRQSFVLNFKCL